MSVIIGIVVLAAIIGGIVVMFSSNEADPKERAKEAGMGALAGAFGAGGCIVQLIIGVLPIIAGMFFLGLIIKSCSN